MKFIKFIKVYFKNKISTINHKDIGILYVLEMLNKVFKLIINVWTVIFQYINKYIEIYW